MTKQQFKENSRALLFQNQFVVNYKRMWPFVKPIWLPALLSVLVCVPIGSLDAVIALFLKPYTDIVVVGRDMSSPWYIPLLIVGFTTVQGLLNYASAYLNTWVGGKLTMSLKKKLFTRLLAFEPAYFDKTTSGEILFRYNSDADLACAGLLQNLKSFITRICSSLALICVLFYNSWQLSIMAIVVLAVAIAPLTKVRKLIQEIIRKNNAQIFAINTTYNETCAGNKTITAYNLQKYQYSRFIGFLESVFNFTVAMTRRTAWMSPFMHIVISIGLGGAVAWGSWLIVQGTITPGNFVSFITALLMLYTPLKNISNVAVSVQNSFLAIERIFELFEQEAVLKDKENAEELKKVDSEIAFNDVHFSYNNEREVLHGINLKVKVGETLALVGNSGGGKSTIASLLPRFYDVSGGSITIDGKDIRDLSMKSLRDNIAVVFQDNFLFDGTIRDNILIGNQKATEEDLLKALDCACLSEFIRSLPQGLDTSIGERGILLSGGQKQRVAIARAFLKNAPIVVLDEATSALDNKSERVVQQAIDNLMKDKTVFVIAHRLSTIRNAHRIAVISEGNLAELGSHDELMQLENGIYRNLYDMQFKTPALSQPEMKAGEEAQTAADSMQDSAEAQQNTPEPEAVPDKVELSAPVQPVPAEAK